MLATKSINEIATDRADVFAFRIRGEVSSEDMQAMAARMNAAFDTHETVSMLLIFEGFEGSDTGAAFDIETIKAQFRALGKVDKYAVVDAPSSAAGMIETMGKVIPVEARTFDAGQEAEAWRFVGASPAS